MRGRRIARQTARRTTRRTVRRTMRRRRRRRVMIGGMVVLAAAGTAAAVKLTQRDAQRIEEHTGYPPEELDDQELSQAMSDLNIQSQPLTAADQQAVSQASEEDFDRSASEMASGVKTDYIEELKSLAELRDQGIISLEEFEAKKKQLLGL